MHRYIKFVAVPLAIAASIRLAWRVSFEGSQIALEERFPHVDPSIVRKVHHEMVRDGFRGLHDHLDDSDETMDAIFWEKVAEHYSKL